MIDRSRLAFNIKRHSGWGYRGEMRLTHKATGLAVLFDLSYARSMHRSMLVARRWLSSIVRHREQPQEPAIMRSYTLAPGWAFSVRQNSQRLAEGIEPTMAVLDGNLDPIIRANLLN